MYVIETFEIEKKFKNLNALSHINLKIKEGEVFSLLGPNGAGKTTLISILTTVLKPTSGTAIVNGYDILKEPLNVRKSIGIVFQQPSLDELLTAYENLYLHSMLYGVCGKIASDRIKELLNIVELYDRKDEIVKRYSGGMKRRLEIARGLLHIPKVLFLDEPTLGLDAGSRRKIWEYIKKIKQEKNITIILTTHYMEEAENLSDRVSIINKGKIIVSDTLENLKKNLGEEILKIKGEVNVDEIKKLNFVKSIKPIDGGYIITSREITKNLSQILRFIKSEDIEIKKTSLEDVFLNIIGKTIEDLDE